MKTITDTVKYLINDNTSTYDYLTEALFVIILLQREALISAAVYIITDNRGEYTFKTGKNVYIVNEIFPEKGKTLEERLVDLILYEIENGKGSGKKETGAEEPIPER